MIRQARQQFDIDLARSFVVGDKLADVGLARRVGARGVLVRTGYGESRTGAHGGARARRGARRRRPDGGDVVDSRRRPGVRGRPHDARRPRARATGASSRASRASRVVVAGDLIADEFIYGQIERVSREAPVLILRYDATEIVPGGAGNAANNAAALGARVDVVGVVGRDERRRGGCSTRCRPRRGRARRRRGAPGYVTPVKTRILAGGVHSAKQQVVRIDRAGSRRDAAPSRGASRRRWRARFAAPTP